MAQELPRDVGPAGTTRSTRRPRRATPPRATGAALLALLSACVPYRPAPVDPTEVLRALDARTIATPDTAGGVGTDELAAFAVTSNPALAALRAELGVERALLVEAGLLPHLELGWDAMDVLASRLVDGTSSSVDALSGLGLMQPLPRPGERGARVDLALERVEEIRCRVAAAEWSLVRDVVLACEEVHAAGDLLARRRALCEVAESTNAYFRRARDAGTATGIEANLARGELHAMRLEELRAEGRARRARHALNELLGLPPALALDLGAPGPPPLEALGGRGPEELAAVAVRRRPDLAEHAARHRSAEAGVRLAVARQLPRLAVGTGLRLELPLFSGWGRPGIDTALARRERAARELTAAVHAARGEVAAAHAAFELAERELALVEGELLPNAEENLALAQEAFREGELTLLETLALQRALVEARTRHTEVRAERSKRAWILLAACGLLFDPEDGTVDGEGPR